MKIKTFALESDDPGDGTCPQCAAVDEIAKIPPQEIYLELVIRCPRCDEASKFIFCRTEDVFHREERTYRQNPNLEYRKGQGIAWSEVYVDAANIVPTANCPKCDQEVGLVPTLVMYNANHDYYTTHNLMWNREGDKDQVEIDPRQGREAEK